MQKIVSAGCVDFSNKDRKLSEAEKLDFDDDMLPLKPGSGMQATRVERV